MTTTMYATHRNPFLFICIIILPFLKFLRKEEEEEGNE